MDSTASYWIVSVQYDPTAGLYKSKWTYLLSEPRIQRTSRRIYTIHCGCTDLQQIMNGCDMSFTGPSVQTLITDACPCPARPSLPRPRSAAVLAQLRSAENATTSLNKAIHKQSLICPSIARPMTSISSLCRGRFSLLNLVSHDSGVYRNHRVLVEIPWFNTMISAWFNVMIGAWFNTVIHAVASTPSVSIEKAWIFFRFFTAKECAWCVLDCNYGVLNIPSYSKRERVHDYGRGSRSPARLLRN
jgi:hypothetical protein